MLIPPTIHHTAKPLAEKLHAKGVIILAFDDERSACTSYGVDKAHCQDLARLLDRICDKIDKEEWPVWNTP